jgi:hypothetical protein
MQESPDEENFLQMNDEVSKYESKHWDILFHQFISKNWMLE